LLRILIIFAFGLTFSNFSHAAVAGASDVPKGFLTEFCESMGGAPNKIIIVGIPGGGKTTFANALRDHLSSMDKRPIALHHVDTVKYIPHTSFKPAKKEDMRRRISDWKRGPRWIIEGNMFKSLKLGGQATSDEALFCLSLAKEADIIAYVSDHGEEVLTEKCIERAKKRGSGLEKIYKDDKPAGVAEGFTPTLGRIIAQFSRNFSGLAKELKEQVEADSAGGKKFFEIYLNKDQDWTFAPLPSEDSKTSSRKRTRTEQGDLILGVEPDQKRRII
jgi:hypothetical protein